MADISNRRQDAEITIPAAYLEDARSALTMDINALRDYETANVPSGPTGPEDRARALRLLANEITLLKHLHAVCGDTEVTAESDTITKALQATVRVLADQLGAIAEGTPIDMGTVLEVAACLRWAAENAIQLDPDLDERKVA